jgi:hypothetical protein
MHLKRIVLVSSVIAAFILSGALLEEYTPGNTSQKEVFSQGYPKTILFRNDRIGKSDYGEWENLHLHYSGTIKKYLTEEVDMDPVFAKYASRFVKTHPEKLMLVHLNGEGIANRKKATHQKFFPGHWIYEAGSLLDDDIEVSDIRIKVENAKPFLKEAYSMHGGGKIIGKLPHDLILVEVDEKGNRNWNQSEYATIEEIDYAKNELIIKRGRYFSKSRSFKKGKTYVAPLAGAYWGGNLMWYYNLSSMCPTDQDDNNCADIFSSFIKESFSDKGLIKDIDGIAFDVNYFSATHHRTWDCDNDGLADGGIVDGVNIWRLGNWDFLKRLRNSFGNDFIITADGWRKEMQCAIGILNGMETEGLCRPNDGYRQISRTINQQNYWKLYNNAKYQFSYITSKLRNEEDIKIAPQLRRLGLGLASCLETAYTGSPDFELPETYGGSLHRFNWLGQPAAPLNYLAKSTPDLLNGAGSQITSDFGNRFESVAAEITASNNTLTIKGTGDNARSNMLVKGPGVKISDGDMIIFFEARAIEGLVDFGVEDRIPRKINVKLEDYEEATGEKDRLEITLNNNLSGFIGTEGFAPLCFYFRNVGYGKKPIRFVMEIEELGEIEIKNLTIHNAPLIMVREFQNGMVLLNTSKEDYTLDADEYPDIKKGLYTVLPGIKSRNGSMTDRLEVKALDASFLIKKQ